MHYPAVIEAGVLNLQLNVHFTIQPNFWWSTLSSLSLGWSPPSSSSSLWGTGGDSPQPPVPEAKVGDHCRPGH